MNGKIVVTMAQNTILIHLLETDDCSNDEALLVQMTADAKVDRHTADSYLRSWRFNHQEGAIGAIRSAVHAINPTPTPAARLWVDDGKAGNKDPAEGTGKVAAIIALHKQGLSNKEIVDKGYNKSTVNRQVSEYRKRIAASKSLQTA